MAVSPDGQFVATGDELGLLRVFTFDDGFEIHSERVHASAITTVSISPDNTLILSGDSEGKIFLWRI